MWLGHEQGWTRHHPGGCRQTSDCWAWEASIVRARSKTSSSVQTHRYRRQRPAALESGYIIYNLHLEIAYWFWFSNKLLSFLEILRPPCKVFRKPHLVLSVCWLFLFKYQLFATHCKHWRHTGEDYFVYVNWLMTVMKTSSWTSFCYTVWVKNIPPTVFLKFFPKRLGIFNQFFTHALYEHFYTRLQICIQLSPTLTKLCHTKHDHPTNFYISLEV